MHHDGICVSANDARDFVACSHRHVPPAFGPGAHPARRPNICVFMQSIESSPRHRAETVRDQIDRSVENRKFRTVFEKVIGHWVSPLNWLLIYHGRVRTGSGSDRIVATLEQRRTTLPVIFIVDSMIHSLPLAVLTLHVKVIA